MADERTPLLGLSDPLNAPTGFGRVARELFARLPQDRFRLGYYSQWVGSRHFPGVATYGDPGARFGAGAFPQAALDFGGTAGERFILWTLFDPWMTAWISHPQTAPIGSPVTRKFFREGGRGRFVWVGHWPIDGQGPRAGPGRWIEDYLKAMDLPVAMSEWGRRMVQPWMPKGKEVRLVSHAVHDGFRPMPRDEARHEVEKAYARSLLLAVAKKAGLGPDDAVPPEAFAEAHKRMFRLGERFTVFCVMANRERKYWPDVLRAFALLLEDVPDARLIGLCGDRKGEGGEDMWPLEDLCRELGLRLDEEAEDPNVWLIEVVQDRPDAEPDYSMRLLYCASDAVVLLSGGEGFGLPQLEAHACGIPCVAGNYSASTELAVHPQELLDPAGWRETPQNQIRRPLYKPRDLAQRLKWIARNPSWRREVGRAGEAQATGRRWEKILPLWLEIFGEAGGMLGAERAEHGKAAEVKSAVGAPQPGAEEIVRAASL